MTDPIPPWRATGAQLGGFFALAPATQGLAPLTAELEDDALTRRLSLVREALAASAGMPSADLDPRVACSALQVGLVSRLWSVGLASALVHGGVPDLAVEHLWLSPAGGPTRLAVHPEPAWHAGSSAAALLAEHVIPPVLAVSGRCGDVGATAPHVLLSNATSSLVGGARVLGARRPELAAAARAAALETLADDRLSSYAQVDEASGEVTRRGCCLFYRLPEHGLCPDCVLAARHPERVTEAH